jgi:hypothetical protein
MAVLLGLSIVRAGGFGRAAGKDGFVSVAVNCELEQPALRQLLYDLEVGMPFLFVDPPVAQGPAAAGTTPQDKLRLSFQFRAVAMKLRDAYSLLATIAVLGAIAAYVGIAHTTAASSDDAVNSGETAPVRTAAPSPDAVVERPPPGGNPLWALPLKQLSITRERPIFSPSRRPPPPAMPTYVAPVAVRTAQKPKEPERPSITLLGTILGSSESIGIFLNPATRDIVRLLLGEDHEGWALRSVKSREVTLVKDREKVVLELPPPGGDQAVAIASPPPAVPQRRGRK